MQKCRGYFSTEAKTGFIISLYKELVNVLDNFSCFLSMLRLPDFAWGSMPAIESASSKLKRQKPPCHPMGG